MRDILRLSVPMTVWLMSFSAVYGLQGLVCSERLSYEGAAARPMLIVAAIIAVFTHTVLLWGLYSKRWGSPHPFIRSVSTILGVVALISTIWTLFPVAFMSICM
ncbi:hypothetical protein [Litorimonas haliclonae]|uniref:hypothetical protein n=1 Tax=Litorimonas haliclonae TaxID=2081977 RepID=UPI0039EFAC39